MTATYGLVKSPRADVHTDYFESSRSMADRESGKLGIDLPRQWQESLQQSQIARGGREEETVSTASMAVRSWIARNHQGSDHGPLLVRSELGP